MLWNEYFRQVQSSQTDLSDPENTQLRAREERLSLRVCTVCYRPFSLLYNRRLLCSSCLLGICRSCAAFNTTLQTWQCFKCSKIRSVSDKSNQNIPNFSPWHNKSNQAAAWNAAERLLQCVRATAVHCVIVCRGHTDAHYTHRWPLLSSHKILLQLTLTVHTSLHTNSHIVIISLHQQNIVNNSHAVKG